ncbi:MAG: hypothetical protein JW786_13835 [Desulfobacterales bacterium]|nr:hypothetical protein [Desulfobacterales bacterium]
MIKCKICLLPAIVPGVIIDKQGICNFCRNYDNADFSNMESVRKEKEADLEKALNNCKGNGVYDCLVPVSGGKDSIYLLYKLKIKYDLKILAFTTNINIPEIAWKNIKRTVKKLDIDHISYSPSKRFYKKLFRYLLKNQEERGAVYTVSYVYAPLFEGDALKIAIEKNIPLVLAGYSPGQPEPERMFYEFSRYLISKTDWTPPELRTCGFFKESELSYFFNPLSYPSDTTFPRYLAPFHAWSYNQDDIMKKVVKLGLVDSSKHANPIYSNYPINWLLMYSDLKNFGYNPYHPEFSKLIREGKANRTYWKIMAPVVNFMIRRKAFLGQNITKSLKWLELNTSDLKITRARGAYDPLPGP